MAPVGDAVRLVHHQHPGGSEQLGQHQVAEARVVQPLRADQQHVRLAGRYLGVYLLPLLGVGRVHRASVDPGSVCRLDLVAHEGEQRRDDDRRPCPPRAQQRGRREVDSRLAPAGALDDQGPAAVLDQGADRCPLVLAQSRSRSGEGAQAALCLGAQ